MLIICSGPDTLNARQKARELTQAFKAKFDPAGFSVEVIPDSDISVLINRLAAPSFFSTKRLIRCDGILENSKIADVRKLIARVTADNDQSIVISVEEEVPSLKILDECKAVPSFFHYPFPTPSPVQHEAWCKKRASLLGVSIDQAIEIAQRTAGNVWLAEQELMKKSANSEAPLIEVLTETSGAFDVADAYVRQRSWRSQMDEVGADQCISVLVGQVRAAARVRDRATSGLHPFVVKKLSSAPLQGIEVPLTRVLRAQAAIRTGLATADEIDSIL